MLVTEQFYAPATLSRAPNPMDTVMKHFCPWRQQNLTSVTHSKSLLTYGIRPAKEMPYYTLAAQERAIIALRMTECCKAQNLK
jgi:hypothetical protein